MQTIQKSYSTWTYHFMTLNQFFIFAVCRGRRSLRSPQSIASGLDLAWGMKIDVKLWMSCGRLIEETKSFETCNKYSLL